MVDGIRFEEDEHRLVRACINTPRAKASVYLQGAHVAAYQLAGGAPLLFMSGKSHFEAGKPLRGGVPICFPWFGQKSDDASAPMHGLARLLPWAVESVTTETDGSVTLVLRLESTAETRAIWPFDFTLRHRVTVGTSLTMTLETTNTSDQPFTFEEALHTYFAVGDVRQVSIAGLAGVEYLDKTENLRRKVQDAQPIRITGETDRVYLNTRSTCVIDDPTLNRRIVVEKSGSDTTVVWNPWIAKAKAMPDFGDEEWPGMVCIETVNARENALSLAPGQRHEMQARIHVEAH